MRRPDDDGYSDGGSTSRAPRQEQWSTEPGSRLQGSDGTWLFLEGAEAVSYKRMRKSRNGDRERRRKIERGLVRADTVPDTNLQLTTTRRADRLNTSRVRRQGHDPRQPALCGHGVKAF